MATKATHKRSGGGRPPKEITDDHLRQIEALAGYGLTEAAIAHVIGLSPATFRRKKNEARVMSALQKGKALAEATVSKALFERAKEGDLTAIIWWEKTRAGRTDKHAIEHSGQVQSGVLVVPTPVTADEWTAVARRQQVALGSGGQDAAPATHGNGHSEHVT